MTRILFVGDTWQGSGARSLREAFSTRKDVFIGDIGEDHFIPHYRSLPLRIASRLLSGLQSRELESVILDAINGLDPDVVVFYKGAGIRAGLLKTISRMKIPTVNVFPDNSPHAHGRQLKEAMGYYNLVISAKPFHPGLWQSVYGYKNPCLCVPHGYDPLVHLWPDQSLTQTYDVALCATWRPEYDRLMRQLAGELTGDSITVAISGSGWPSHRFQLPHNWKCFGPREGRAYGEFLRSAKIVIAPLNRDANIQGVQQPGDEDSTRSYELAAAHCFFLHQRSKYIETVYDDKKEVPFWSSAAELAALIRRWLPDEAGRRTMAAKAHARAVPAYSIPDRAASVLNHIEHLLRQRNLSKANS
jgi:hypothetical protein